MVKQLNPKEAYELLQQAPRVIFLDVRSNMEFLFVGHPHKSFNVAWIDDPDWKINQNFVGETTRVIERKFDSPHTVDVLLICRSGVRSLEAGEALLEAGFKSVYSVDEGFEGDLDDANQRGNLGGWRFHGLPWVQS